MNFRDIIHIVIKLLIASLVFVPLIIVGVYLIHSNINIAYYISDGLNIPRDLSITTMSAGFANNIIIVMTAFEFGFMFWIINKITKTKIYESVKEFVINL